MYDYVTGNIIRRTQGEHNEGRLFFELGEGSRNIPKLRHLLDGVLPRKSFFDDFEVIQSFPIIGGAACCV